MTFPFNQQLSFLLLLLFCSISCRDTIDLLPEKEQLKGISIQGKLVKGTPSVAYVEVERVFTFSGESRKTLSIATVSIVDEEGYEFFLSKNNSISDFIRFIYEGQTEIVVDFYQKYACRVVLQSGVIYESNFETLLPVPKIENLEFEVIEKSIKNILGKYEPAKFARFRVNTPLIIGNSPSKSNLRWIISRSYKLGGGGNICTDAADFSHISVLNGSRLDDDFLRKFNFYDEYISQFFGDTYVLTVFQESLTDEAFEYWSELENLTQRKGNQFEATPGVIRSNFKNVDDSSEKVYGYFYATANHISRIRVCPDELGFQPNIIINNDCGSGNLPEFWEDCD